MDRNQYLLLIRPVLHRRPFTGAWIETYSISQYYRGPPVAPSRGRGSKHGTRPDCFASYCRPFTGAWIETSNQGATFSTTDVAPSRGRGSKLLLLDSSALALPVAPSRGRGSKLLQQVWLAASKGSPLHGGVDRNGENSPHHASSASRPFTGAWIETNHASDSSTSSSRRPFTGAWIETLNDPASSISPHVAPSRGRGSKRFLEFIIKYANNAHRGHQSDNQIPA